MNLRRPSIAAAAGLVGALANSLAVWGAGALGLTRALGANLAPALSPGWLYPRLVWGALWALLLLVPLRGPWWKQGLLVSLAPSAAQLFYFFPRGGAGTLGLERGPTVPLFVLLFNALWGVVAAWWFRRAS